MAKRSSIEWTEMTWNPVTGCSKVSPGCKYCYAERMALRLQAMGQPNYVGGFSVAEHATTLMAPFGWRAPKLVFVNSMSDLFHEEVSQTFIQQVFATMVLTERHQYQVLTKRSERLLELAPVLPWPANVWMGVSVESEEYLYRIDDLRATPARIKFLSLEPLLGPVPQLNLAGINWVIVGGESGPRARLLERSWVSDIRDQCRLSRVPFFFKQWGGVNKKRAGRELDGMTYDEMPSFA